MDKNNTWIKLKRFFRHHEFPKVVNVKVEKIGGIPKNTAFVCDVTMRQWQRAAGFKTWQKVFDFHTVFIKLDFTFSLL